MAKRSERIPGGAMGNLGPGATTKQELEQAIENASSPGCGLDAAIEYLKCLSCEEMVDLAVAIAAQREPPKR